MNRRVAGVSLLLLACCALQARPLPATETAPETLLPADTAVYLRLHAWADVREAYAGTALSEVLRGDLGRLLGCLGELVQENKDQLLQQTSTKERRHSQTLWNNLDQACQHLLQHGMLLGLQVRADKEQTGWQLTLIFPEDARSGKAGPIQRVWERELVDAKTPRKKIKAGMRTLSVREGISTADEGEAYGSSAWWVQDGHFVLTFSSTSSKELVKQLSAKNAGNITQHSLFRSLAKAQSYPTLVSGYVDPRPVVKALLPDSGDEPGKSIRTFLKEFGLNDLHGLTFRYGFEGKAWRESYSLELAPKRRGFWQLVRAAGEVDIDNLPALPPDATGVWIGAADFSRMSAALVQLAAVIEKQVRSGEEQDTPVGRKEELLKDLLGALGPQVVWFNSPSEGYWLLDQALAIQVKDTRDVQDLLRGLYAGQNLLQALGIKSDLAIQKKSYRGVDYWTLQANTETVSLPFVPSFVVHDGWLVAGLNPQVVQGYILRTTEKVARWQPSPELRRALAGRKPRERVVGIAQQDIRETTRFWLSLAPWLGGVINASCPGAFDATLIPNAHAVTGPMFPNVTLMADDGRALRFETYASVPVSPSLTSWMMAGYGLQSLGAVMALQEWSAAGMSMQDAAHSLLPSYIPGGRVVGYGQPAEAAPSDSAKPKTEGTSEPSVSSKATKKKKKTAEGVPTSGTTVPVAPPSFAGFGPTTTTTPVESTYSGAPSKVVQTVATVPVKHVVKVYDISGLVNPGNPGGSSAELKEALMLVAPMSWKESKDAGTLVIITHPQRLIVRQSAEIHAQIEELLRDLKKNLPVPTTSSYGVR